jgi:hypothetical protein
MDVADLAVMAGQVAATVAMAEMEMAEVAEQVAEMETAEVTEQVELTAGEEPQTPALL